MPITNPDPFTAAGIRAGSNGELYGYKAEVKEITSTTYTLQAGDSGKVLEFNNASPITVTVPATLAKGWCATVVQAGAGTPTFTAGSGATINEVDGNSDLAGQWAVGAIYIRSNAGGSAAVAVLTGKTA